MIISLSKAFIFIHIPRTAGTSITSMLLPFHSKRLLNAKKLRWEPDYPHYTALTVRDVLGRSEFENYFKFAFVRNPWERILSRYFHLKELKKNENRKINKRYYYSASNVTFQEWLLGGSRSCIHELDLRTQVDFLFDREGNKLVDFIGRFESLHSDIEFLSNELDIDLPVIPKLNASKRGNYKEHYTEETRDVVSRLFQVDIEKFGYEF